MMKKVPQYYWDYIWEDEIEPRWIGIYADSDENLITRVYPSNITDAERIIDDLKCGRISQKNLMK